MTTSGHTATFRVVGVDEFPHGFRCMDCKRPMNAGQPYGSRLDGFAPEGEPIVELVCAYCATDPGETPSSEGRYTCADCRQPREPVQKSCGYVHTHDPHRYAFTADNTRWLMCPGMEEN